MNTRSFIERIRLLSGYRIYLWDDKIVIIYNFTPVGDNGGKDSIDIDDIIKAASECSDTADIVSAH